MYTLCVLVLETICSHLIFQWSAYALPISICHTDYVLLRVCAIWMCILAITPFHSSLRYETNKTTTKKHEREKIVTVLVAILISLNGTCASVCLEDSPIICTATFFSCIFWCIVVDFGHLHHTHCLVSTTANDRTPVCQYWCRYRCWCRRRRCVLYAFAILHSFRVKYAMNIIHTVRSNES